MSEHNEITTPEQERARALVRDLPVPEARAEFRARLKEEFVSGTIASSSTRGEPSDPARTRRWFRSGPARLAVPLAAAAALILMFNFANRGANWQVEGGHGQAHIDGVAVSLGDMAQVEALLRPGCELQLDEGAGLRIYHPGNVLIEVSGGGKLVVPTVPSRWFGTAMRGEAYGGRVRFVTGPEFASNELVMATHEGEVTVHGTSFTLWCFDGGTCVCVLDGDVTVECARGSREIVSGGHRRTLFADGSDPSSGDMHEDERVELGRLQTVAANVLTN